MNERYGNERYGRNRSDMSNRYEDDDRQDHGSRRQQFRDEDERYDYEGSRSSRQFGRGSQTGQYASRDQFYGSSSRYGRDDEDRYGSSSYGRDEDRYGSDRASYARDRDERQMYGSSQGYSRNYPQSESTSGGASSSRSYSRYRQGSGGTFGSFTGDDYGGRDFSGGAGWSGYGATSPTYGVASSGIYGEPTSYRTGRSDYGSGQGGQSTRQSSDYGSWRSYGEERGFLERAGDEIASWFGDEEATRRREQDHRGRGPANYTRSDERIREDVNDHLTRDWAVDASDITVSVSNGEVTLDGKVGSRIAKRRAEDCAEEVSGVRHVQNNLRIATVQDRAGQSQTTGYGTAGATSGSGTTGTSTGAAVSTGATQKTGASTTTTR